MKGKGRRLPGLIFAAAVLLAAGCGREELPELPDVEEEQNAGEQDAGEQNEEEQTAGEQTTGEQKEVYPITLEAAIPHPGRMKTPDKTFQKLIRCCDNVKIHSDSYFKGCYMRRNRYMINQSQRVIAVYDGRPTGGTATTVRYAKGKDVRVVWK